MSRDYVIPPPERVLMQVWWTDCTNVAGGWHDAEDLEGFATNGAWETQVKVWSPESARKYGLPDSG